MKLQFCAIDSPDDNRRLIIETMNMKELKHRLGVAQLTDEGYKDLWKETGPIEIRAPL